MTVLVKIQTIRPGTNEMIGEKYVVGESVGDCFDSYAPDPREGAIFKVIVFAKEVHHA